MKIIKANELREPAESFQILGGTERTQVAAMTLEPGEESGPLGNEHPHADQVLYVIEGEAEVQVESSMEEVRAGDTVIIPAGAAHQIRATGNSTLRTLNIYAPPAY